MLDRLLPHHLVTLTSLAVFAFLLLQAPPVLQDPDVAWHIAAGDYIAAHGLPDTDPFSFTAADTPWYNVSWAFDVAISAVVDVAGLEGLRIFTITLIAATMGLLMHTLIQREAATQTELCVVMAVVALSLWPVAITARPQLISFVFVVLSHHLLHQASISKSLRPLYFLPILTVLWANCHGGFLAVYVMVGAYGLAALKLGHKRQVKQLAVIGALCVIAAFVTPYHIHMIEAVMRTLNSVITGYIEEWQPLKIQRTIGFAILFFSYLLLSNYFDKKVPLADKILPTIWLVLAMESMRNVYFFALVAAPFMVYGFHRYHQAQEPKETHIVPLYTAYQFRLRASLLALVVWGCAWVPLVQNTVSLKPVIAHEKQWPTKLFDWLSEHHPQRRFYHDYHLGGALLYGSELKVFADGRAGTAYPESVLRDVIALSRAPQDWEQLLDTYQVQGLIIDQGSPFSRNFDMGLYKGKLAEAYSAQGWRALLRK